jgi:DNA polymerase I-like protein with 3'-5' exonuclease and polymerase domains
VAKKDKHIGGIQLPLFEPPSTWKLPTEFPDLSYAKFIGIDVESRDPNLLTKGPGFIRRDANVVGISLATESKFKIYLPFAHAIGPQLDKKFVVDYVKAQISRPEQIKVGANLMYELEALDSLGLEMKGPLWDVQIAGPLLDEENPEGFSLEALGQEWLGVGKSEQHLQEAADAWGLDKKRQLWMMPPQHTGAYAEDDAYLPIEIIQKQIPELQRQGLMKVWDLETKLQPVLWKMRKKGVRVDIEKAEQLTKRIVIDENNMLAQLRDMVGIKVDPWSAPSLMATFKKLDLSHLIKYTEPSKNHPTGQPSFTNDFFKLIGDEHPALGKLVEYRNTCKMRRDFIEGVFIDCSVDGRLHPNWHQLRADDEDKANGTKTGRVASSKVNLTQIPSRHPVWGKKVRSLLIADEGGEWCKHDFSQQEPRLTVHFGYLKKYAGAAEARQRYIDDPSTDYHQLTADLIEARTGRPIADDPKTARRIAKDINLGSAYGMGKYKLAAKLNIPVEEAEVILKAHREGVPFVKKLEERCMEIVSQQGYIRTILGRKRRFDFWEPQDWDKRYPDNVTRDYDEAVSRWGKVTRAYIHKALNAMIQGTAADQTKTAIVMLDEMGLCPQIQVYDELNQTIYDRNDAWRIKEVMENCLPELTVPHLAQPDCGPSWGEVIELKR